MKPHCRTISFTILSFFVFSSCSMIDKSKDYAYLNTEYHFSVCGDIHGLDPFSGTLLYWNEGYTDYSSLFNKEKSIMNFQCYGTSVDDFYCEASLTLFSNSDSVIFNIPKFRCHVNVGLYYGEVVFEDQETKEMIGHIYIHTPYWCRIQFEYNVGEKVILLTCEYTVAIYNPLPDFMSSYENNG